MLTNYRRCISCRKVGPKESFWRIVRVYPSREVQLERGMGRSAYICRSAECLRGAKQKNKLGRSLKASVPEHIYQSLSLAPELTILPKRDINMAQAQTPITLDREVPDSTKLSPGKSSRLAS